MPSWVDPDEADPADIARAWHWSEDCDVQVLEVADEDLPDPLVACGRWVSATLADGTRLDCDDESYLAFDPTSPLGRLYLYVTPDVIRVTRQLWRPRARAIPLGLFALSAGGPQQGDYPEVLVQGLGELVQVEYWAKKYGDGAHKGATFFHDHDGYPRPWLALSEDGRLWYAGGSYDARDLRGIVG